MEYNAASRLAMWQKGRDEKTVDMAARIGQREMQECSFSPKTTTRTPTKRNKCDVPSPAMRKHFARLELARKKAQAKTDVPHATGNKWTGKTTVAKAPQLSCFRKKTASGYSSSSSSSSSTSSSSSSSSSSSASVASTTSKRSSMTSKRSSQKIGVKRGSFSSPCPRTMNTTGTTSSRKKTESESSAPAAVKRQVATEYVPSSRSDNLTNELTRLRNELQAEEERHAMLTAEKLNNNSTTSTMVVAAPPSSPFVSIAPPAPPPGPPPRSGKQSPEPCNYYEENENNENDTAPYVLLGGDRQPSGQRRADHFDLRSERLSRSGLNQQNEGEWNNSKNMEKSETTMMLTSITGRSHSQSNQNNSSSRNGNNKAAPKEKAGTPDWETIQKTIHYMMDKDVSKRKIMENRLRSLEENNLKILGINHEQFKSICGKDPVTLSPAPVPRKKERTHSAKKANNKHVQRMGKAMSNKLLKKSSSLGRNRNQNMSTMSNKGGALGRSSRGLS